MFNKSKTEEGNTIGNIRNYGYGAISGNYIYYLSPNEDSSKVGIFRIKNDGSDKKEIYMCDEDLAEIVSINVYGNYIYFIQIGDATDDQDVNNKIYRMKKDGSDIQLINDNEFNDNCYEIYVINGYVYYIDVDANVARMELDGSNKEKVVENKTGYLGITKDYIIYNVANEEQTTQDESDDTTTSSTASYTTYIMNIDGSNQRPIFKEGKRLYSVNIEGDYIYYTNDSKNICRTRIDSNEEEVISNVEAYNLNVNNGFAYYLNYKDAENEDYTVCIYKIPLNAEDKTPALIKELDSYSTFLDIVGNYALYMDSNDTSGSINLVDVENSENIINLYYLDYESYSADSNDTDEQVTEENVTEEDVVSTDETQTNTDSENTTSENTVSANNNTVNNTAN